LGASRVNPERAHQKQERQNNSTAHRGSLFLAQVAMAVLLSRAGDVEALPPLSPPKTAIDNVTQQFGRLRCGSLLDDNWLRELSTARAKSSRWVAPQGTAMRDHVAEYLCPQDDRGALRRIPNGTVQGSCVALEMMVRLATHTDTRALTLVSAQQSCRFVWLGGWGGGCARTPSMLC